MIHLVLAILCGIGGIFCLIGAAFSARALWNLLREGPAAADRAYTEGASISRWWNSGTYAKQDPVWGTVMNEERE